MHEHDEHISDELRQDLEARDVIERNQEQSRRLLAERAERENEPPRNDPRHNAQGVAPGQQNLPIGGNSNPNSQGGSSKRHKPD
jgi:hypothetical protein